MKQAKTTAAALLGGLLAASAWATDTSVMGASSSDRHYKPHASATVTSNVPMKAGEASTMTNGVPNVATHNPNPDEGRLVVPLPQRVSEVPTQAGEASTMVGGRPNAEPNNPVFRR
jgi:hypothetical protein